MANIIVKIPNGDYCSDKNHRDCFYAQHSKGEHYCHLFRYYLSGYEFAQSNNILIRKCEPCLNALHGDLGPLFKGPISIQTEDEVSD